MKFYTDYPIEELGDTPNKEAPIRECVLIDYDFNKYVTVMVDSVITSIKSGYIYKKPGRSGDVPCIMHNELMTIFSQND
jgi:hypothetical protein